MEFALKEPIQCKRKMYELAFVQVINMTKLSNYLEEEVRHLKRIKDMQDVSKGRQENVTQGKSIGLPTRTWKLREIKAPMWGEQRSDLQREGFLTSGTKTMNTGCRDSLSLWKCSLKLQVLPQVPDTAFLDRIPSFRFLTCQETWILMPSSQGGSELSRKQAVYSVCNTPSIYPSTSNNGNHWY